MNEKLLLNVLCFILATIGYVAGRGILKVVSGNPRMKILVYLLGKVTFVIGLLGSWGGYRQLFLLAGLGLGLELAWMINLFSKAERNASVRWWLRKSEKKWRTF